MRIPKTLTVEQSVLAEVDRTRGKASTSERVNQLLKRALEQERREQLELEAERFYAAANQGDREEERAFQEATLRTLTRD